MSQNKGGYVPFVDSSSPPPPPVAPQVFGYAQPNPAGFVLPPPEYNGMPGAPGAPGAPGGAPFPPPGAFMHPMYGQSGPGFPQAPFPQMAPYNPPPPNPNPAPNPAPYQYTPGEGACPWSSNTCHFIRFTHWSTYLLIYLRFDLLLFYETQIRPTISTTLTSRRRCTTTRRSPSRASTTRQWDEPSSARWRKKPDEEAGCNDEPLIWSWIASRFSLVYKSNLYYIWFFFVLLIWRERKRENKVSERAREREWVFIAAIT